MKVQISDKVTGEIRIPVMNKTFRRGAVITMTEDEFFDSVTQWSIRNGYLSIVEDATSGPSKPQGTEYRLVSRNPLSLRCVGRTINPGEVFYVPHDKLGDGELAVVLGRGMVVSEADFQKKPVSVAVKAATAVQEQPPQKTTANKKKSQTKAETKTEPKAEMKSVSNDSLEEPKIPANMYAHVPDAVKGEVKPKMAPGRTTIMLDLDEGAKEQGELSFVDNEQADARKLNIAKDNDEVV